ncbi:MAG: CpaF family protein, partial [Planctomycetaceae bacterium]|nr:CpaF family protein [Planctomycetaceae bacterium]
MVAFSETLDPSRQFQQLKTRLHRQIVDSIDMSKAGELGDGEFRRQLEALALHLVARPENGLPVSDRPRMVQELLDEIYGFGPIQEL